MDVCMCVCMLCMYVCVSTRLRLNILETNGYFESFPIGRKAPKGSWMTLQWWHNAERILCLCYIYQTSNWRTYQLRKTHTQAILRTIFQVKPVAPWLSHSSHPYPKHQNDDNHKFMLTFQCLHLPTNAHVQTKIGHQIYVFLDIINCDNLQQYDINRS